MKEEQLNLANDLVSEKREIKTELDVWCKDLTSPKKLAYRQSWNNLAATEFKNSIPKEVFEAFRLSAINALKLRLTEIEQEFKEI